MTGQKLSLSGNEVGLFAKNEGVKEQKTLTLNDHQFSVKEEFTKDFIVNHVPNQFNILTADYNYLVVPNLQAFLDQFPDSAIIFFSNLELFFFVGIYIHTTVKLIIDSRIWELIQKRLVN